jgi:CheY-like chemotaxis protein
VEGFVAQSGGFVTVDSREGVGSAFSIYLPRTADETVAARAGDPAPAATRATILIVEDEATVRAALVRMAGGLGYAVVEASTPARALAMVEAGTAFDALVTDVVMPGMNGRELAERISAGRPGLPVLYMSGYAPETVFEGGMLAKDAAFLAKPFSRADLASALGVLIGRREPSPDPARGPSGATAPGGPAPRRSP